MNGKYLLDTNIVIAIFKSDKAVLSKLETAEAVFLPLITIGELYFGAYNSKRKSENVSRLEDFIEDSNVIGIDEQTTRIYGDIKFSLKQKDKPIPENDIWNAAIAIQHNLKVLSRDLHFNYVDRLIVDSVDS